MMDDKIQPKYLIDILGGEIKPGDICIFSVRGWGMEAGVFIKETRKKLSFRIPCWWCVDKDNFSVSAINKTLQQQRVLVLRDPWFYLDIEKIAILLRLKDSLINKGILKEECNGEQYSKCSDEEKEEGSL